MPETRSIYMPQVEDVRRAAERIQPAALRTPLQFAERLSKKYAANIYLKREDLQTVRSYKIRGAYNKMSSLSEADSAGGVCCASAGNHAQGVALSCRLLKIKGTIFMPVPTPKQKIDQVLMFGEDFVEIELVGDTFDDAFAAALSFSEARQAYFIPPFDDPKVIEGQATIGLEMVEQAIEPLDYLFMPIGGGGLSAGVSAMMRAFSPQTKIIGVEPAGAPAMKASIEAGKPIILDHIEKFVDGAAVKRVGDLNFEICRELLDEVITVEEGLICEWILELYNRDACVVEPAGALSLAALDQYREEIKGKNVACVLSGSNNDITRTEEIKERALLYGGLKHYFIVSFPQRAGALREFVVDILGPTDDISHFEYTKKTSREKGSAVVGIELKQPEDFQGLLERMKANGFFGDYLNDKQELIDLLV
ncbi:MAG: threonine ammonia-lyase [Cyclobacteriaceae bacterium]|nr:threonine ammonia-lyase [Cyclobacteriaceae bacterium]MCH8514773.1 threonine ammonia-lyase [Cyclobacteriaceae bacterium]